MIELMMVYYFKQIFSINDTAVLVALIMKAHQGNRIAAYETFKNRVAALTIQPASLPTDTSYTALKDSTPLDADTVLHYALSSVIQKQMAEFYMDALTP
jgi:elongation factor P--beta-lysine ligase